MSSKYATTHYHAYLQLEKILGAQELRSAENETPAHDEMLFIIIHQAYELWFKQIIHEMKSMVEIMQQEYVDERSLNTVVARMERIIEIQELLIQQIRVLETMSPLEFLDFRDYLFPASGFQSFQFRVLETLMGLRNSDRTSYNNKPYHQSLEPAQQKEMLELETGPSLLAVVEKWLERIPFIEYQDFHFLKSYKAAVERMMEGERNAISRSEFIGEEEKTIRLQILANTENYFLRVLNPEMHSEALQNGEVKLSYRATVSALFIVLYSAEPMLSNPAKLISKLIDIDELFTTWRYRHAQMVMRLLGKKMGTGGSSGHDYLKQTAAKHHVFGDFHNISTLLVPRSNIPNLPPHLKNDLNFHFSGKEK